ncbi:MAG: SDR family oxidoreductase [Anaerolineae bacterium]|nr:SDR family oxidoreductase [Anaerolineae bacterium]
MVLDSFRLDGKVALITGGARTLGYDMAEALAEAGCHLVITSRDLGSARTAAASLMRAYPIDVLPVALDVREYDQVVAVTREAHEWKGRIDILINNAGGTPGQGPRHLFERSPSDMAELITLNLIGPLYCCREVARVMAERRSGKIINIASIAGMVGRDRRMYDLNGMPQQPVDYAAAKAGVIGMTRDLAALLAPYGIYVNSISPGGFERGQPEGFVRDYSERTALGRMGRDGADIKAAALFLASPASDYVTGHNLVVDGGFTIWH